MKTWIRRTLIGVASTVVVAAAAVFALATLGDRKLERRIEIAAAEVPFATDATSVERGGYLFRSRGCADCHGAEGTGKVVVEDGASMLIRAPNLTTGPGGVTAAYRPVDWVRSIRHGVRPDGRPLIVMPSEEYNRFTDADLAAVVAYVRQLPPKAGEAATIRLPLPVRALYAVGVFKDASEKIDHRLPPAQPVSVGVNTTHGAYVANMCMGCHGEHFSGGKIPGGPPDWPPAANLTPGAGSVMTRYDTPERFIAMMRSGKRPDGSTVDKAMPFQTLAAINDTDLQALYAYFRTLAPREAGKR